MYICFFSLADRQADQKIVRESSQKKSSREYNVFPIPILLDISNYRVAMAHSRITLFCNSRDLKIT